jgi:predicted amidohydrolase
MKIALLQMEVLEKNKEANVAHGLQLVRQAADEHDLLVMPEIWTTGYSLGRLSKEAEAVDGEVLAEICKIAAEKQCSIIAGSVPMSRDGKVYNTSVAINKAGQIVNMYDKVHLFGLFKEEEFSLPAITLKPLI